MCVAGSEHHAEATDRVVVSRCKKKKNMMHVKVRLLYPYLSPWLDHHSTGPSLSRSQSNVSISWKLKIGMPSAGIHWSSGSM